ncbi:hypothetical protein AvCA_47900 [Azotobacter vinelandii CA]|uniref:Uncharacterized protein n=2 Tax=Azotobacter vinelandii TaxID=354 RepID=C1DJY9_AZOVD|nr:hypothetical protein [Azotobacter vinelandii]ACO80894.1 hypothetical protein Avin_47900 [Azotobacter vinelandii DJ]AGK15859.1 hypothetical protein AvCA_47900 [Azotobacter vinelandii CA]AGK22222.1 hypothetical protein AvCA6_47900 [Azotobacter vinelandii CA6]WKN21688.1 hypothetical protein AVAEIV_004796 [Azotobacter vinelandii]SFX00742.1 hypothetical protein SAMN04244547_00129 [Azotobacter vinelandii]
MTSFLPTDPEAKARQLAKRGHENYRLARELEQRGLGLMATYLRRYAELQLKQARELRRKE